MVEHSPHESPFVVVPTVTSTSAPSSSTPSSQGVDLYELERLRVLVRFEFDREATTDELATALTRCHNNTREAYHLLKEQRRLSQLTAAAAMVTAAASISHGGASAPTSASSATASSAPTSATGALPLSAQTNGVGSNGTKRRNGDDGDVLMDTPTKRQRAVEEATVDLSQEDDAVMTQATQMTGTLEDAHIAQSSELLVDKERASRTINAVVTKILSEQYTATDESEWLATVGDALMVRRSVELDHHLVVVVEALAETVQHVASSDIAAVHGDGVDQIMQVLLEIPRLDQYELVLRLSPTDDVLNQQIGRVENIYALARADELTKSQQAQAAKNAITEITDACALCVARQESIRQSVKQLQAYRRQMRHKFDECEAKIKEQLTQARRDVELTEREMNEARDDCKKHGQALMEVFHLRRDELLQQGFEDVDVFFEVNSSIVTSTNADIIQRRKAREDSHARFIVRKQDVMRANTRLVFFQKLYALAEVVKPRIHEWLNHSNMRTDELRAAAERAVEDKLKIYIPKLTQVLGLYYEFHTKRQHLAGTAREDHKKALAEHEEYYDDLAPSTKQGIQEKIREFSAVIMRSTQQMREVASMQSDLWQGKQRLFSREFFALVEGEYGKLWQILPGGAKDMMLDCVNSIRCPPVVPTTAARLVQTMRSATSPRVSVSAGFKIETNTQHQFVSQFDHLPVAPVARGIASTPTSPIVDLTGDEEDDEMDGGLATRMDFDTPSTRITRIHREQVTTQVQFVTCPPSDMHEEPHVDKSPAQQIFPIGAVVFSYVNRTDDESDFFRCQIKEVLEENKYLVVYDEGDQFTLSSDYLYTQDQVDEIRRAREQEAQVASEEGSSCVLM